MPDCGAWAIPDTRDGEGRHDFGLLLTHLESYLDVAFARFPITHVAYEAPILVTKRHGGGYTDNLPKLRLLYPLSAFVEYYCRRRGIEHCYEVTVSEIKTEVTGNRHAEKGDLIAIAQKCGLILPSASQGADDAADAWGAWLLLLRAFDKNASARWDKAIWTPRGALL